jgi:hypothetical protein
MEGDLNFLANWKQPKFLSKVKDDLILLAKWKTTSIFKQIGRQPQFFRKWKTNSGNVISPHKVDSFQTGFKFQPMAPRRSERGFPKEHGDVRIYAHDQRRNNHPISSSSTTAMSRPKLVKSVIYWKPLGKFEPNLKVKNIMYRI